MKTRHLFEEFPYLKEFDARIVNSGQKNGVNTAVLDQTLFYPASGGQPADRGWLGEIRVTDVVEEGEVIVHHLEKELPAGDVVHGRIDWERRFDHMQQHTGQHILSQAFYQKTGAETIGFHLGESICTIDLDKNLDEEGMLTLESGANAIIFDNRSVHVRLISGEDLKKYPMRKPPAVIPARVIEIEDYDFVGCCGTHVRRTGDVGIIKILRSDRYKGGTRITFVCGRRALLDFQKKTGLLRQVGRLFHIGEDDLLGTIQNLFEEKKILLKRISDLLENSLVIEAGRLKEKADRLGDRLFVHILFHDRDTEEVQMLVRILCRSNGVIALAGSAGEKGILVLGRSQDVDLDVRPLIRHACEIMPGKGGGSPSLAQAASQDIIALEKAFAILRDDLYRVFSPSR